MSAAEKTQASLAKVTAPVLVIAGEQDPGPLPAHAAELAGIFPHETSIVLPGAHHPWVTAPYRVLDRTQTTGTTEAEAPH